MTNWKLTGNSITYLTIIHIPPPSLIDWVNRTGGIVQPQPRLIDEQAAKTWHIELFKWDLIAPLGEATWGLTSLALLMHIRMWQICQLFNQKLAINQHLISYVSCKLNRYCLIVSPHNFSIFLFWNMNKLSAARKLQIHSLICHKWRNIKTILKLWLLKLWFFPSVVLNSMILITFRYLHDWHITHQKLLKSLLPTFSLRRATCEYDPLMCIMVASFGCLKKVSKISK